MIFELGQYSDITFLVLRLVIATIFIYHALPKLKNASGMSQMMGNPCATRYGFKKAIKVEFNH